MILRFFDEISSDNTKNQVWNLLCACDNEFYPSLSSRENTSQSQLNSHDHKNKKPFSYFSSLLEQCFICAYDDENMIGFLSFIPKYSSDIYRDIGLSNYVSTICVDTKYRGLGITYKLYDFLFSKIPNQYCLSYVTTRTWSLNDYHIKALHKMRFVIHATLKNHRGQGIDTVYFKKKIDFTDN
ncbi:MAG: GNAT family N-acetyltransferase [Candidatus Izemoplasmatales bacterium]|nr:GNAT family N-acetyltransferase [Candidatus Izemoplasmatales bacterium]MDD5293422.1 GNAT family N-acetyltransferase [Candidatus Izemoplasmatales bacterium]